MESVLNQSLTDIEIICVNDGSTDSTLKILNDYSKMDGRIRIIDKENSGYGDSVNIGIDSATGEYLAIVEPDDYVDPDMYQILYRLAKTNDVDIVKADFCRFIGEGKEEVRTKERIAPQKYCNKILHPQKYQQLFHIVKMNTWAGIYRLKMINQYGIRHNTTPGASYQDNGFWFKTTACAETMYLYDGMPLYMNRRDNPNSSVYAKDKIYNIFKEYHLIEDWLISNKKLSKYGDIFYFKKFSTYYWHYLRICRLVPDKSSEYRVAFSNEFKDLYSKGLLCKKVFDQFDKVYWKRLMDVINNPVKKDLYPMFDKNNVAVCYASDENYAPLLAVSIKSLIKNCSPGHNYDIVILEESLSQETIDKLLKIATNKNNVSIRTYDVTELVNTNECQELMTINHISMAAYYRLFVSTIFKNYSRILYLDCDLLILSDIKELYDINLNGKICAAAVNLGMTFFDRNCEKYSELKAYMESVLNIYDLSKYFNSGVMVFDIDRFKEGQYEKQLIDIAKINNRYMHDQNVLNSLFYNSYQKMSFVWNYQWNVIYKHPDYEKWLGEDLPDFENAIRNPKIIHYLSPTKPWNNSYWLYSDLFWEYARGTPFEELLKKKCAVKKEESITKDESINRLINQGQCIMRLTDENVSLHKELESMHNSWSYKIGRAITYIPRKLKH